MNMKTKRQVIRIDESLCNGCGACIDGCHEGALQLIDGKARMVSELYCDGLGACIGECPVGAITIEERETEPYNENAVMERISSKGEATVLAHLKHLKEHGEMEYLRQGIEFIRKHDLPFDLGDLTTENRKETPKPASGCPGSMARSFETPRQESGVAPSSQPLASQLAQWPVQLHLLNPQAGYFRGADVVLAADCAAYAFADFHNRFIRNHILAIACPKLDSNKETYIAKITDMIDSAQINSLTVVIMEVPCCSGLVQLARIAAERAARKVPMKVVIIGLQGEIVDEKSV